MRHEHGPHRHHILPHERKSMMKIEFNDEDRRRMLEIFGDEDTAFAAEAIIIDAPPEIQIVAVQLMNIIKGVA